MFSGLLLACSPRESNIKLESANKLLRNLKSDLVPMVMAKAAKAKSHWTKFEEERHVIQKILLRYTVCNSVVQICNGRLPRRNPIFLIYI